MAKGSSSRSAPKATNNAALVKKVMAADAKVKQAEARKDLIIAQIEVKGKIVERVWDKPGDPYRIVNIPGVK